MCEKARSDGRPSAAGRNIACSGQKGSKNVEKYEESCTIERRVSCHYGKPPAEPYSGCTVYIMPLTFQRFRQ